MEKYYGAGTVANILTSGAVELARAITDSYFLTHRSISELPINDYAKTYLQVFEVSLQEIGNKINSLEKSQLKSETTIQAEDYPTLLK